MDSQNCFRAAWGAVLGLLVGPFAAVAIWELKHWMRPPLQGEAIIGAAMSFWFELPVVLLAGLVLGALLGGLIGLLSR